MPSAQVSVPFGDTYQDMTLKASDILSRDKVPTMKHHPHDQNPEKGEIHQLPYRESINIKIKEHTEVDAPFFPVRHGGVPARDKPRELVESVRSIEEYSRGKSIE